MKVFICALLFAFSGPALARTWTVFDVSRTSSSNHALCNWALSINQSEAVETVNCVFQVEGNATVGCEENTFGGVQCSGDNIHFQLGGGWSNQGFVVMNIADTIQQLEGWFGWSDTALNSGEKIPEQKKFVEPVDKMMRQYSLFSRDGGDGDTLEGAPTWRVANLERMVFHSENKIWMNFTVQDEAQHSTHCSLMVDRPVDRPIEEDQGENPVDLGNWSWFNQKCSESEWSVSWGFMEAGDAGIMTVVNPARNRRCMFGFNNVNAAQHLGSAGPYSVADCDCA